MRHVLWDRYADRVKEKTVDGDGDGDLELLDDDIETEDLSAEESTPVPAVESAAVHGRPRGMCCAEYL